MSPNGFWFRLLTGTLEIAGAALVLAPPTAVWGASMLAAIKVGAVGTHLAVIGGNPALVLLALSAVVLWLRRRQLLGWTGA